MAKKALEKSKRDLKKRSHQQVVSRTLAKTFLGDMKTTCFVDLRDVGYFGDKFTEEVLVKDVMPWLYEQSQKFCGEMASQNAYPTSLVKNYLETKADRHVTKV